MVWIRWVEQGYGSGGEMIELAKEKRENQIIADTKAVLDGWISAAIGGDDLRNWRVIQTWQPSQQAIRDKVIGITPIYDERMGFVGSRERIATDEETGKMTFVHQERYRELMTIQVDIFRIRLETDDVATLTAGDVARQLRTWLNSLDGIDALARKGFSILNIADIRKYPVEMADDRFSERWGFEFDLVFDQMIESLIANAVVKVNAYGV